MKSDPIAGQLEDKQDDGGPRNQSMTQFYIGINDPIGMNPTNTPFDPKAMTLFSACATDPGNGSPGWSRAAIARGETVFNTLRIAITGVKGQDGQLGVAALHGAST